MQSPARMVERPAQGGHVTPLLSIVTTVYDRVDCLEECVRSVASLNVQDVLRWLVIFVILFGAALTVLGFGF